MALYVNGDWFPNQVVPEPFDQLPPDAMAEILMRMNPADMCAFSEACKSMHSMLWECLELVLCQLATSGELPLTYVTEHKPLINRVRVYVPEFTPLPCDYAPKDEHIEPEEETGAYDYMCKEKSLPAEFDPLRHDTSYYDYDSDSAADEEFYTGVGSAYD